MKLTQPKIQDPIGWVVVNGQRLPVALSLDYARFFESLIARLGGPVGPSVADLETADTEDQPAEKYGFDIAALQHAHGAEPGAFFPGAETSETRGAHDTDARIAALEARIRSLEEHPNL